LLGLESVSAVVSKGRLRLFGRVACTVDAYWLKGSTVIKVDRA